MKNLFFVNSLLMLLFCSCNNNLENDNLNNALKEIQYNTLFSIKDINTVSWDTMFISKPYNYQIIKEKGIDMPSDVDKKLEKISREKEGYCALIFVKNHSLVNYSIVPRTSVADFAFIDSPNQGLPLNSKFEIVSDSISTRKVILSND